MNKGLKSFSTMLLCTIPLFGDAKPLFMGDSLTYQLAMSYKERAPVDAQFLESTGLHTTKLFDWQNYIQQVNFQQYDAIYIVLGTNDPITQSETAIYQRKVQQFIKEIKKENKNIVWLLPPTLKNEQKNTLLNNTRIAIQSATYLEGIRTLDMRNVLGTRYTANINGMQIRTDDGIHITQNGADSVINEVIQLKKAWQLMQN